MILLAWAALAVCALLWHLWTPRELHGLVVYFGAGVIGVCFALAAIFDHFARQIKP